MVLSIIIVNYNVKYFLEQCLSSVARAIEHIDAEVWVVDNASSDGSIEYLATQFPWVNFIANQANVGFGRANNMALGKCAGEYVLFLNPDTILPEDCLTRCLAFIRQHPETGALGIRMIDGSGAFLPESKRSFPSPITSFYKLSGLSKLFPKSRIFSRYSLAYLDEYQNHEVDVLAGAFMLVRRNVAVELNGFDETFFMYGEDIDLSYRVQKSGYKNCYFSESCIIHFKGESTKKGSLNYVKMFYEAMSIFVRKHYAGPKAQLFAFFIQIAIWIRAAISALLGFLTKIGMPLVDAILIYAAFKFTTHEWIVWVRHGLGFIETLVDISLPAFTLVFLAAATFAGIYDNKYKPVKAVYAAVTATVVLLAVYSLLPEQFRFSRGVILTSSCTATIFITAVRWFLLRNYMVEDEDEGRKTHQTIIVGTQEEYNEVKALYVNSGLSRRIMGWLSVKGKKKGSLGTIRNLDTFLKNAQVREIVLCQGSLTNAAIIKLVQRLQKKVSVRFHAKGTQSIVGSDSKNTSGESVSVAGSFSINSAYQRRMKRVFDVLTGMFILATFPIHLILAGAGAISNSFSVLVGRKTWVGYSQPNGSLPILKDGVLTTVGDVLGSSQDLPQNSLYHFDYWYAKNYDWTQDWKILWKNYKHIGKR